MWGSEFLNETLIMLLLLFHITEQLLIRKKNSNFQNRKCYKQKCHRAIYF